MSMSSLQQMLGSLGGMMQGVGQQATPGMQQAMMQAVPVAQNMAAQTSPWAIGAQGLGQVGKEFIDKNVEARHQMPLAPTPSVASNTMGPLPFGSSNSPLLTYLSMLGSGGR